MNDQNGNAELELATEFIEQTGEHLFLTGKAGTGKTTFLRRLKQLSNKRMVVTAPTGVAALNAGGVTVHSFFQLPFGPIMPNQEQQPVYRFAKEKINIIRSLDLLVIDEISMVRADVLDGIDAVLRRFRNARLPFGGVQLLLIGDLHQLPPVVKPNEWSLLSSVYNSPYFFSSLALQRSGFTGIELKKVYRQSQVEFIELLNAVREERWTADLLHSLNVRFQPLNEIADVDSYIILTTHNYKADVTNQQSLKALSGSSSSYIAKVEGDFPAAIYPVEAELVLKVGARVMFTRNDPAEDKKYYNGKIGIVEKLEAASVTVFCEEDHQRIRIEPATWENSQYKINPDTNDIDESVIGSFQQIPLRLAWAITIHKSQGLTFDKAIIDAQDAFTSGQTYVALSRCRSLEGLVLSSKVRAPDYSADEALAQFDKNLEAQQPNMQQVITAKRLFQQRLLAESFDFSELRSLINRWLNALKSSSNVISTVSLADLTAAQNAFETTVVNIAQKFQSPLQAYCSSGIPAELPELTARLTKAGVYFTEHLRPLLAVVDDFRIETDNRADEKRIRQTLEQLNQCLRIKVAIFNALSQGFDPTVLLKAKAQASLVELKASAKKASAPALTEADIPFPELFEMLRKWRKDTADAMGVKSFTVLHQKALVQIVCHLPDSQSALLGLPGIGPVTVERYGNAILDIVSDFAQSQSINLADYQAPEKAAEQESDKPERAKAESGKGSYLLTLEMYQGGKTISDIAEHRGLVVSTVENHLAQAIEKGQLPLKAVLADDMLVDRIKNAIKAVDGSGLKPVKEMLGDAASYGQIRWVQADLAYSAKAVSNIDPESV